MKIKIDGTWKFEHRVVMEQHLGRSLSSKEVVHHINGDTIDNRIENLQLFSSTGKHIAEHMSRDRKCSINGCERKHSSRGLCRLHSQRLKKFGNTDKPPSKKIVNCSIDGCTKPHAGKGFCAMHYERFKKYGDPFYERETRTCSVVGCTNRHVGRGYCVMHYMRFKRHGLFVPNKHEPRRSQ